MLLMYVYRICINETLNTLKGLFSIKAHITYDMTASYYMPKISDSECRDCKISSQVL